MNYDQLFDKILIAMRDTVDPIAEKGDALQAAIKAGVLEDQNEGMFGMDLALNQAKYSALAAFAKTVEDRDLMIKFFLEVLEGNSSPDEASYEDILKKEAP